MHDSKTIGAGPIGLAEALRLRTRAVHIEAERSGIIREVLQARATRKGYALLLHNLLPVYLELERGIDRHTDSPGVRLLPCRALYRAAAIESDLCGLFGPQPRSLAFLPEGVSYVRTVAAAASGDGIRLIAHAYVRYLGDLSGGLIVKDLLMRSMGLNHTMLAFYDFPNVADIAAFKTKFRDAINRAEIEIHDVAPIIDEAVTAFALNIALSEAVYEATRG